MKVEKAAAGFFPERRFGAIAGFKDGVLAITLPKADIAKPRSIPLRGAFSHDASLDQSHSTEVEIHDDTPPVRQIDR